MAWAGSVEYIEPQSIPNTEDTQPQSTDNAEDAAPQTDDKENDVTHEGNLLGFVLPGTSSVQCCAKRKIIPPDYIVENGI